MKRTGGVILVAALVVRALACSTYGEDEAPAPAPSDDAGTTTRSEAGAGAVSDATADATDTGDSDADISPVPPAHPFAPVTYGRADTFEWTSPTMSPFVWQLDVNGNGMSADFIHLATCADPLCSPSQALEVRNNDEAGGYVESTIAPGTRKLRLDFSMKVTKATAAKAVGISHLASFRLASDRYVVLDVDNGVLFLADQTNGGVTSETKELSQLVFGEWAKYRVFVDFDGRLFALERNGVELGRKDLRSDVVNGVVDPIHVRLGITYVTDDAFTIDFDDVGVREWK